MWLVESDGSPTEATSPELLVPGPCVYDQEDGGEGGLTEQEEVMMSPLPVICRSQSSLQDSTSPRAHSR